MCRRVSLAMPLVALALLVAPTAHADKIIWQHDDLPGDMTTLADGLKKHPMSAHPGFVKGEAFGQIFQPQAGDYPVKILSVELVMAAAETATPPFAEVPIAIEIYNDDAVAAAPSAAPIWSINSSDFFNPATGKPGMNVVGNTGMIFEFDWSKPENHPPPITKGNIRVVIRVLGNAKDNGEYWEPGCSTTGLGICQCAQLYTGLGLDLCGCQDLAALTDSGTTPKVNVLEIVYPLGACSGSKKWVWLEDIAKEGKQMKGDFLLRLGVEGFVTSGPDAGSTDAGAADAGSTDSGPSLDTTDDQAEAGTVDVAVPVLKPSVALVTPDTGSNDAITQIEIIGEGFADGAIVKVGTHKCAVDSVTSTKIVANVLSGIPAGSYPVVVENPNGQIGFKDPGFTVTAPAPAEDAGAGDTSGVPLDAGNDSSVSLGPLAIELVEPRCAAADADTAVTIYGTGFGPGLVLELGGTALIAVTAESSTKAKALVPKGMPIGLASLVASQDGKVASLANAVEVGCGSGSGKQDSGCSAATDGRMPLHGGAWLLLAAAAALLLRRQRV